LLEQPQADTIFANPFFEDYRLTADPLTSLYPEMTEAAKVTVNLLTTTPSTENEPYYLETQRFMAKADNGNSTISVTTTRDILVSIRVVLRHLIVSLVDSAPSEIAVISFRNVNGLASWNMQRTNDANIFLTINDLQIDNMVPSAPFPVAVGRATEIEHSEREADPAGVPMVVVGLSIAPRHSTGIMV
jgi:hypothetical protein